MVMPKAMADAYYGDLVSPSIWNVGGDWKSTIKSPDQSLDSPTTRQSMFTRAAFDITDNINVYLQYSWNYASVYSVDNYTYNIANISLKPIGGIPGDASDEQMDLVADLAFARSEALRRNTAITLCRSSDGTTCATSGDGYQRGWIVFPDGTGTGTHATDGSEPVLRRHDAIGNDITVNSSGNTLNRVTFNATLRSLNFFV